VQSELDSKGAQLEDAEAALADARAEVTRLTGQVESLRHQGDASGSQLAAAREAVATLSKDKEELSGELQQALASGLQAQALLEEVRRTSSLKACAWEEEAAGMSASIEQWREKATRLQGEVRGSRRCGKYRYRYRYRYRLQNSVGIKGPCVRQCGRDKEQQLAPNNCTVPCCC
jgi:chromosome segregation ATPase